MGPFMAIRTGAAYVAALRDGREVWQAGRRIADVTTHPGFAGSVQTLAALYEEQHDPAFADVMTRRVGGRTHLVQLPPAGDARAAARQAPQHRALVGPDARA